MDWHGSFVERVSDPPGPDCRRESASSRARQEARGAHEHHGHEDRAEDPGRVERHVVDPELRADVGEPLLVQVGEHCAADDHPPDVAHPAQDDHREDERGDVEREVVREGRALEAREERAGDAAEERAARVRPGLRPHQRDPHRGGRDLVLPDRDPRAAEPRVAEPDAGEDRDREQDEAGPEVRVVSVREREVVVRQEAARRVVERLAEAGWIDGRDPVRPVREVEAGQVVPVPGYLGEDLAEAEGDYRQVVAAQTERGQPDHDPDEGGHDPREQEQDPDRDMDPGDTGADADVPEVDVVLRELNRCEPGRRVRTHGVERDVAEVEESRPADDDVQAEREQRVVERVEADALVVAVARRDPEDSGRGDERTKADRRVDARGGPFEGAERPAARSDPLVRARDPLVDADPRA